MSPGDLKMKLFYLLLQSPFPGAQSSLWCIIGLKQVLINEILNGYIDNETSPHSLSTTD